MSRLPKILKNFNVYAAGNSYLGVAEEVTPPNVAIKTSEMRLAGMAGAIEVDQGVEKLENTIKFKGVEQDITRLLGTTDTIVTKGAVQNKDGATEAVIITSRGLFKSNEGDTYKVGEDGATSIKQNCEYYKYEQNGETIVEIDMINGVRIIDGIDQLEEITKAIL